MSFKHTVACAVSLVSLYLAIISSIHLWTLGESKNLESETPNGEISSKAQADELTELDFDLVSIGEVAVWPIEDISIFFKKHMIGYLIVGSRRKECFVRRTEYERALYLISAAKSKGELAAFRLYDSDIEECP